MECLEPQHPGRGGTPIVKPREAESEDKISLLLEPRDYWSDPMWCFGRLASSGTGWDGSLSGSGLAWLAGLAQAQAQPPL